MAEKPRTLILSDESVTWLKTRGSARGTSMSAEIEAIVQEAMAREAGQVVEEQASGALEGAIHAGIGAGFDQLVQQLGAVFDLLTIEAVRARMTAEEHLAYMYDSADLQCPHCHKPYVQGRPGPSFAAERSAVILQKAREALAAGAVPRIRTW